MHPAPLYYRLPFGRNSGRVGLARLPIFHYSVLLRCPGAQLHVPGSRLGFTQTQIDDSFNAPDWFTDHPRMPQVVARGRKPDVWACAACHLPN
jgi:hypothetical protein